MYMMRCQDDDQWHWRSHSRRQCVCAVAQVTPVDDEANKCIQNAKHVSARIRLTTLAL